MIAPEQHRKLSIGQETRQRGIDVGDDLFEPFHRDMHPVEIDRGNTGLGRGQTELMIEQFDLARGIQDGRGTARSTSTVGNRSLERRRVDGGPGPGVFGLIGFETEEGRSSGSNQHVHLELGQNGSRIGDPDGGDNPPGP